MTSPITVPLTAFAENEVTTRDSWYSKVLQPFDNQLTALRGNATAVAATLLNSWANFDPVNWQPLTYRKQYGVVYVQGRVNAGTPATAVIFNLPAGFRPSDHRTFLCASATGAVRVDVLTTGDVQPVAYMTGGSNTDVQLNFCFAADL